MSKYIDLDALGVGKCNPDVFKDSQYANGWNNLMKILHDAPVADVAEVKHGKWLADMDTYKCSLCGFGLFMDNGYYFMDGVCFYSGKGSYKHNYCPNCGANMDLEEE